MKLIILLFTFSLSIFGQLDSGKYEGNRAFLLLRGGGHFTIQEWGGYINGGVTGQYSVNKDTLILTDICDQENNITRTTHYFWDETSLKVVREAWQNHEEAMKRFKIEHNISDSTKVTPGSLKKYGDFKKIEIPWDFNFIAFSSVDHKFLQLSMFSFNSTERLKEKTINKIIKETKLNKEKELYITKDYFASIFKNVNIIDNFKLKLIEVLPTDSGHVRTIIHYKKLK